MRNMVEEKLNVGDDTVEEKATDGGISFLIFRIVVVVIMLAALLVIKYFAADAFDSVKSIYDETLGVNVTAEYYIGDA